MRWLVLTISAFFLLAGCDLNPQPEVPGFDEPEGAGGSMGAAGATGDLGSSGGTERGPGPPVDFDPDDDSGGLHAGAAPRPDGGRQRESADAGADDAAAPPVVVVQ